jgi:hypothetical protein
VAENGKRADEKSGGQDIDQILRGLGLSNSPAPEEKPSSEENGKFVAENEEPVAAEVREPEKAADPEGEAPVVPAPGEQDGDVPDEKPVPVEPVRPVPPAAPVQEASVARPVPPPVPVMSGTVVKPVPAATGGGVSRPTPPAVPAPAFSVPPAVRGGEHVDGEGTHFGASPERKEGMVSREIPETSMNTTEGIVIKLDKGDISFSNKAAGQNWTIKYEDQAIHTIATDDHGRQILRVSAPRGDATENQLMVPGIGVIAVQPDGIHIQPLA